MPKKEQVQELIRTKFKIGEDVILDKGLSTESKVIVVSQTPGRLFTTIRESGCQWEVMTCRISPLPNNTMTT